MNGEDDGLMDGGATTFGFDTIGDTIEGVVEKVERRQRTDKNTGKLLWWDEEKTEPKEQFVFTLAETVRTTAKTEEQSDEDDGRRRIYAKKPGKMLTAITTSVRTAKHKGSTIGGTLKVQFSGEEAPTKKGNNPTKLFRARFAPGTAGASADEWDEPGADRAEAGAQPSGTATPKAEIPF
jgi:hypothetical protein